VYEIWWALITRRTGGRITREDLNFIMGKIEECARNRSRDLKGVVETGIVNRNWMAQQGEMKMQAVASSIRRDLKIKLREQEAFPSVSETIQRQIVSNEVFVIVAASQDLEALVREAISPAIKDNALQPFVMTAREPDGPIGNEILAHIESAVLVIADLTHERPNCYYEVGYAHAKGKRVIFSACKDHDPRRASRNATDPKIHFDLDSHKFSFWETGEWSRLRVELRGRIAESLRRLRVGASFEDRRSETGEEEILNYMSETQSSTADKVVFNVRAIAQEIGWPTDDVEVVLTRLVGKALVKEYDAGCFVLANGR
jgi:nucleoside 2-deoxyribosyltransferase